MNYRNCSHGKMFNSLLVAAALIFVSLQVLAGADEWELRQAAKAGDIAKIKELLEDGADIDGQSRKGYSAIHHAAMKGHLKVVELLIKEEADIDNVSAKGSTPLISAAYAAHPRVVQVLLAAGADTSLRSKNGNTALDLAIKYDDLVSAYLIEYGSRSLAVNLAVSKSKKLTAETFRYAASYALEGRGWTVVKETDNQVDAQLDKRDRKFKVSVTWNGDHISIRFLPYYGAKRPNYLNNLHRDIKSLL